jgi:hypothetical protein
VVAERLEVGFDGVEEVERLVALGPEREDSRRGVVACTDHDRSVVPEGVDGSGQPTHALGVVVGVLDVRVVDDAGRHRSELSAVGEIGCHVPSASGARVVRLRRRNRDTRIHFFEQSFISLKILV